jgi:hypothetical protein
MNQYNKVNNSQSDQKSTPSNRQANPQRQAESAPLEEDLSQASYVSALQQASADAEQLTPVQATRLQRTVGNRKLGKLLQRQPASAANPRSSLSTLVSRGKQIDRQVRQALKPNKQVVNSASLIQRAPLNYEGTRHAYGYAGAYFDEVVKPWLEEVELIHPEAAGEVQDMQLYIDQGYYNPYDWPDIELIIMQVNAKIGEENPHFRGETVEAEIIGAKELSAARGDSSGVKITHMGVEVHLDVDQKKHQHPTIPIGTRDKGGGNRFTTVADAAWHQANTMIHMAEWAAAEEVEEGAKKYHGQAKPVDGIHYEGYVLNAGGKKYVFFHCYPNDSSDLKL